MALHEAGRIGVVAIDGRVGYGERLGRLDAFRHDASVSVLLMTIGTGAVGYVQPPQVPGG